MEHSINKVKLFETLKAEYTVDRPETIQDKVAEWAFDDAHDIQTVIDNLERIDCAACFSPAPVYFDAMAHEIAKHWPEIDDTLYSYVDSTGEAWMPRKDQSFLSYLWFAYEWTARDLAAEFRSRIED